MNLLGPDIRTLEIHPVPFSRLIHRTTSSGTSERSHLGAPLLTEAIGDAASLGYNCLHIGGEDPLQCAALHTLCAEAHRRGMAATLQLRQNTIDRRVLEELEGSLDLLGVVLEGRPAVHGRVRKCVRLKMAHESGIPFVAIFRLTRNNLGDLEWAAQYAIDHGALGLAVRASGIDSEQLATAWMVIEFLRDLCRGRLAIGFETPNRYTLPADNLGIGQWHKKVASHETAISKLVTSLVIDPDGMVLPLRRAFPQSMALGDLHRDTLRWMAQSWAACHAEDFAAAYSTALSRARSGDGAIDFFDLLSEEAGRSRQAALAAAG